MNPLSDTPEHSSEYLLRAAAFASQISSMPTVTVDKQAALTEKLKNR